MIKPYLLAQVWGMLDHAPLTTCATPDCMGTSFTFRIRRAEMGVYGSALGDRFAFKAVIDPIRALEFKDITLTLAGPNGPKETTIKQPVGATTLLQDLFLSYSFEYADITAGQFRIPVSWESYNSSAKTLLPERALVVRQFSDKRDIGLRVSKTFKRFSYGLFLLNGAGQNTLDFNVQKDMALRLEAYPIDGMMIGLLAYSSVTDRGMAGTKDRWEGDLRFERAGFIGQAEFIRGRDKTSKGWVDSYGLYAAVGYTYRERVQAVIRYGHYDPSLGRESGAICATSLSAASACEANVYEVGVNAFILGNELKVQASYSLFGWTNVPDQHQVIVATQLAL
ncbi:MAG: porin [Myxococcales bacterium]